MEKDIQTEIYMFDATGKNHAPGIVSIEVDLPFLPLSRFSQKGDIEKVLILAEPSHFSVAFP